MLVHLGLNRLKILSIVFLITCLLMRFLEVSNESACPVCLSVYRFFVVEHASLFGSPDCLISDVHDEDLRGAIRNPIDLRTLLKTSNLRGKIKFVFTSQRLSIDSEG